MDFSVFYTCFTENKAVDYSISVLKTIYPDVKIYLVSDGGSDFSYLEKKHTNLETFLEVDSRSFIPSLGDNFRDPVVQSQIKRSILTFLDRVNRAIEFGQSEYLLVMEPDVLVRGRISNKAGHALLGSRINQGLSSELKSVLSGLSGAVVIDHWGAVPAIFNTKKFKMAYSLLLKNEELLSALCLAEKRLANYDVLFPVLFALIGEEESYNPEIVECFRDSSWERSHHPLVHQFRAKYPLKGEGYSGTHVTHKDGLGDKWLWRR